MTNYSSWPLGGMLSYVRNILPSLESIVERHGDSMRLYGCIAGEAKDTRSYISLTEVKVGRKVIPNSLRFGAAIIKNKNLFKDIDVVYSHTESATIALRLINRKCKIVHHQHGLSYKEAKDVERFHNAERWLAQKLADKVLVVASDAATKEHGLEMGAPGKYYAIGSPIPFSRIRQIVTRRHDGRNGLRFIYTGRLNSHKNVRLAIRAFSAFQATCTDSTFTIIGDGPDRQKLEDLATNICAEGTVSFLGRQPEELIYRNLANADVMLFPSKGEGVSLSVLEALAAGVPVVCLDVVGLRDLIVDGETGCICKVDTPEEFAKQMERASQDHRQMSAGCIKFASRYAASAIAEQIASHLGVEVIERQPDQ
ncbi:glycosyltransferase family 4 protein [Collinsella ihumii]|uniref:glycosyltransferase family 4 protein n=1 Tax=Collinsella ihumii TaxID=1720204 RepID=UPI0025AA9EB3|nr:glycosyltransferase family 4 protein [Collinsella ihumii]MDN0055206.1 glycosyltransferase family 4 protein [Collinsella ihumii]